MKPLQLATHSEIAHACLYFSVLSVLWPEWCPEEVVSSV